MSKEVKDIITSVKARLQNKARSMAKPFSEILQYYGIERFLYRLSLSPDGQKFVLKGGMVFIAWGLPLGRPTRDIDLRAFTSNSLENLAHIVSTACLQPVPDDGLVFHSETVRAQEIQTDADYHGVRVTFLCTLGNARIPMQIDLGFSDDITPAPVEIHYATLLAMQPPALRGYPPESVISEKYQAIVHLDEINSRMKDYYDIWLLSNHFDFDGATLQAAIAHTFKTRQTTIPIHLPFGLSSGFASSRSREWQIFLSRFLPDPGELKDMDCVLERLRAFLLPPTEALAREMVFSLRWKAGKGWEEAAHEGFAQNKLT